MLMSRKPLPLRRAALQLWGDGFWQRKRLRSHARWLASELSRVLQKRRYLTSGRDAISREVTFLGQQVRSVTISFLTRRI